MLSRLQPELFSLVFSFLNIGDLRSLDTCSASLRLEDNQWCTMLVQVMTRNVCSFLKLDTSDLISLKHLWQFRTPPKSMLCNNNAFELMRAIVLDDLSAFLSILKMNWWIWDALELDKSGYSYFYRTDDKDDSPYGLAWAGPVESKFFGFVSASNKVNVDLRRVIYIGMNTDPVQCISLKQLVRQSFTCNGDLPKPFKIHSHAQAHDMLTTPTRVSSNRRTRGRLGG
mgnify:CR=1 FL=1